LRARTVWEEKLLSSSLLFLCEFIQEYVEQSYTVAGGPLPYAGRTSHVDVQPLSTISEIALGEREGWRERIVKRWEIRNERGGKIRKREKEVHNE
jgi:hypothetical protein